MLTPMPFMASKRTVIVTASQGSTLNLSTLFSAGDWASTVTKRVVIQSGVTIGSSLVAAYAIRTGTGRGGKLEIELNGSCLGAGGLGNSGTGGSALLVEQSGVTLSGTGILKAGGGGGGFGGTGGGGYYTTPYTATDGPYLNVAGYSLNETFIGHGQGTQYDYYWAGVDIFSGTTGTEGSGYYGPLPGGAGVSSGAYTYYVGTDGSVWRTYTAYNYTYTSGGAGGAGGRGQGYDGANAGGAGGGAPGTNAGWGGTGGAGGTWGAAGATGQTGGAGNNGGGQGGSLGGPAGYYINGSLNLTNNFTGGVAGRIN